MTTLKSLRCALWAPSALAFLSALVAAQNETPSRLVAVVVAPARWEGSRGEDAFLRHTGDGGQQYITMKRLETNDPGLTPTVNLIDHITCVDGTLPVGALLHTGHGGSDSSIIMESFRHGNNATAMAAAQARLTHYRTLLWITTGANREIEITQQHAPTPTTPTAWWAIYMYNRAITNRGAGLAGNKPLVYIATCYGALMGPAYFLRGARVWVGNEGCVTRATNRFLVETFFARMDGQEGQLKRPVWAAHAAPPETMGYLGAGGKVNTTLAPSVLTLVAPCPIRTGHRVSFTFDTTCDTTRIPQVEGTNKVTFGNLMWIDPTTLKADCMGPATATANFEVRLKWPETASGNNGARLDGNTDPPGGGNAKGPAEDDYVKTFACGGGIALSGGNAFCFGDESGSACPCGNAGGPDEGCANSTGSGAILAGAGSTSASTDDLVFTSWNLLPNQPALLFAGLSAMDDGDGMAFGDGLRCAGGRVVRLGVEFPDAQDQASWGPGLAAEGGWSPGDMRRFQVWYRDPSGSPCGTGVNLSHGVEVIFTP